MPSFQERFFYKSTITLTERQNAAQGQATFALAFQNIYRNMQRKRISKVRIYRQKNDKKSL